MKLTKPIRHQLHAFTLLEVILALLLFSISAVSLLVAITKMGELSNAGRMELQVMHNLKSLLAEASKASQLEEGEELLGTVGDPSRDTVISFTRVVEELTEMQNMDGEPLQNMWRVAIIARWEDSSGEIFEEVAETFRYLPLYQPSR